MSEMLSKLDAIISKGVANHLPSEEIARQFLEAMKTPTQEMWKAAMPLPGDYVSNAVWWERMIDAAQVTT